ncbi:MAG: tetratricopeptide repeat protein [Chitinophagales bacterium]
MDDNNLIINPEPDSPNPSDTSPETPDNSADPTELPTELPDNVCQSCGSTEIENEYEFPLCTECRNRFSSQPLPKWISVVSLLILVIMAVALARFPKAIDAAVDFERGQRAEKARLYATATREYQKAVKIYPKSTLLLARLCVSEYENGEAIKAGETFSQLAGRKADEELVNEINPIIQTIDELYYPNESLMKVLKDSNNKPGTDVLIKYIADNPDNIIACEMLASDYFDQKNYVEAEKLVLKIIKQSPDYKPAIYLLAAIYRERSDYEKCRNCCNQMLNLNAEDYYAYKSLAEIELKLHNDVNGLRLAKKAVDIQPHDGQNLAILALAYHYNGKIAERDKAFNLFLKEKDFYRFKPDDLRSTFSGQVNWR